MNVSVTVKVSLRIRACGKGSWAVRGFPPCSRIRQQCGQTLHSVLFLQMCPVLNSTSHNRECSEGLTVNGLQVITPPHNMYRNTGVGYFSHAKYLQNDDKHTHTHNHRNSLYRSKVNMKLTLLYHEGEHPMHYGHNWPQSSSLVDPKQSPALWLRPPLPRGKCGLHLEEKLGCSVSDTRRGLKCPVPHPRGRRHVLISDCTCLHPQICLLPALLNAP